MFLYPRSKRSRGEVNPLDQLFAKIRGGAGNKDEENEGNGRKRRRGKVDPEGERQRLTFQGPNRSNNIILPLGST